MNPRFHVPGARPLMLSVGQCGYDDSRIGRVVGDVGAGLDRACDAADALEKIAARKYALVLVNRLFDSDGDSGIAFIAAAQQAGVTAPLMLVSDFAEAQAAAVSIGALPGFGKSQLGTPAIAACLRAALASAARHS